MNMAPLRIGIATEPGDAPYFVAQVEALACAVVEKYAPSDLLLIKVKSWFGLRWLGFSGTVYPQVPSWLKDLAVPPFLPSRILAQRRFAAPEYLEMPPGQALHVAMQGRRTHLRSLADIERGAAIVWFSGASESDGRGSLMVYIPAEEGYIRFYVAYSAENGWHLHRVHGITHPELSFLLGVDGPLSAER